MKLPKELENGFIIFSLIAIFFLFMEALSYSNLFYLRLINIFFVFYGVNRSIKMNLSQGKKRFVENAASAIITSLVGVFLSAIGLVLYSHIKGGDSYIQTLPRTFLFAGHPSINTYSICLLFEGIASSVIVTMLLMLYWNNRFTTDEP
ncbi:hypothetical protein ACMDB5_04775 [Flavobacterium sp. W1B]|uniref:hypothetical protein n=1 Tax=Flavobacterium sp. W1B TaxID=3394146 RepID=UPI0039BD868D